MKLSEFCKLMVQQVVDYPDLVKINEQKMAEGHYFMQVLVCPSDFGRALGRNGVNMDAIRKILNAAAGKQKMKLVVHLDKLEKAS